MKVWGSAFGGALSTEAFEGAELSLFPSVPQAQSDLRACASGHISLLFGTS